MCSCKDYGMRWSNYGPIPNKKCVQISEPMKTEWGENRYLCMPEQAGVALVWSHNGIPIGAQRSRCMEWRIPGDISWSENYLCGGMVL